MDAVTYPTLALWQEGVVSRLPELEVAQEVTNEVAMAKFPLQLEVAVIEMVEDEE